ncbi:MAG: GAF domain-containing sensor histidine kinase [Magnetococcales bacterium]|nr:GAF domain-containing sensor histidine kinase [Magnetococcales bacterium]
MPYWRRYSVLLVFSLVMVAFLLLQGGVVFVEQRDNLNTIHHERLEDDLELIATMAYEAILKNDFATLERVLTRWAESDQDIVELKAVAANGFVLAHYRNSVRGEVVRFHERLVQHQGETLIHIQIRSNFNRAKDDIFRLSVKLGILSTLLMVLLGVILWWVLWLTAVRPLEEEIGKRKRVEAHNERISNIQEVVNDLLRITLQPAPLNVQMQNALCRLLTIPWLAIESRGAIFLANRDQTHLTMVAQKGMEDHVAHCQEISFGQCLCGQAAAQKNVLFVNHLDDRHERGFAVMQDHGHYCVPVVSSHEVLGVINLYVAAGHPFSRDEEQFMQAVSKTLEGLILRQRSEDALRQLNEELEQRVALRTAELQTSLENLDYTKNELFRAEKMAALGRLVAGVSHEINTPVGIGYTAASFLEERTTEVMAQYRSNQLQKEPLRIYMESVEEASRAILTNLGRAAQLIRSFKQVAVDQSASDLRMIQLNDYLHEIMISLRPKFKQGQHKFEIHSPPDLVVNSYPGAFFQIITNLVMNSLLHGFEARKGGTISLDVHPEPKDGKQVLMVYRDNGKGIDEVDQNRIFEPFYTTKKEQGGSGLGLHIVYNLVTQSLGGSIVCRSHPGEGTEFIIRFPSERGSCP